MSTLDKPSPYVKQKSSLPINFFTALSRPPVNVDSPVSTNVIFQALSYANVCYEYCFLNQLLNQKHEENN